MDPTEGKHALIALLQLAYSGELAAAHAYAGHARSLRDPAEREEVLAIEREELEHRARVGEMLVELGSGPDPRRELRARRVGRALGHACRVGGWFVPMYGAGRLESHNVREYEAAARYAWWAGRREFVADLLHMAEVEWEHELFFRQKIARHPLRRVFPAWQVPPPKARIRADFERFQAEAADYEPAPVLESRFMLTDTSPPSTSKTR